MWETIRRFLAQCFGCMSRGMADPPAPSPVQVIMPAADALRERNRKLSTYTPPPQAPEGHPDPGHIVFNITVTNESPVPPRRHHHGSPVPMAYGQDRAPPELVNGPVTYMHSHMRRHPGRSNIRRDRLYAVENEDDDEMERKANRLEYRVI